MQCRAILPALQTAGLPQHAPTHMKPQSAVLPREAAKARRARLIGIALMCGAVGTFSCLDTTPMRAAPGSEQHWSTPGAAYRTLMLGNSGLVDNLAPLGCIRDHPVAHFFRGAPARLQSKSQHPLLNVRRRQRPPDLSAERADDLGRNAAGRSDAVPARHHII